MVPFDEDRIKKLPYPCQFFDVNEFWYFPNRWVVRTLYPLPVSPNQITGLSILMGILAAGLYVSHHPQALVWGAILLYGKLFFDNVDGPLARTRGEVSRLGRFFDSFTDLVVNLLIYLALSYYLVQQTHEPAWWAIGFTALLSCFIHCSLFVFYLVQYTSRVGTYEKNRPRETVTQEDKNAYSKGDLSPVVYYLQRFHEWGYDWQDYLIEQLDAICRRIAGVREEQSESWYGDKTFLSLASPLCLCTNTMALILFSIFDQVDVVFLLIIVAGNIYMSGIIAWKIIRFRLSLLRPGSTLPLDAIKLKKAQKHPSP